MLTARCATFLTLLLAAVAAAQNYDSIVYTAATGLGPYFGDVALLDMQNGRVTTIWPIPGPPPAQGQRTRGGFPGPDGLLYLGLWAHNAIGAMDPKTGAITTMIADSSDQILGAPYQPAPDYDAVGGFGFFVIDGNQPPGPAPANSRNTVRVNFGTGTFRYDGYFPAVEWDESDCFPNLFKPGTFVGVPHWANDFSITEYPLATSPPQALKLTTLAFLANQAYFDALWAEDGMIYVWGGLAGIHQADVRNALTTLIPVQGLNEKSDAAFWNEPWEKPGMKAYLLGRSNRTIFALDLASRPIVAVKTQVSVPFLTSFFALTGRHAEEGQLWTWWTGRQPGERNFHLNFGARGANRVAALLPSLMGLRTRPLLLQGLELYLRFDNATWAALAGALPYRVYVTLDGTGQADIRWRGFGRRLGISAYWQAFLIGPRGLLDVSDIIHVNL